MVADPLAGGGFGGITTAFMYPLSKSEVLVKESERAFFSSRAAPACDKWNTGVWGKKYEEYSDPCVLLGAHGRTGSERHSITA